MEIKFQKSIFKEAEELWEKFSYNIKYVNRYFMQKNILGRLA